MIRKIINKTVFHAYEAGWSLAIPFLKKHKRISDGFQQRIIKNNHFKQSDIWIQAASGGEAFLALELLKKASFGNYKKILLTSNTRQGLDILEHSKEPFSNHEYEIQTSFSPFDKPVIMEKAITEIAPKVMVLIELEMWPGLLRALKNHPAKTIIVNGRLTEKSLRGYLKWPSLWREIAPDKILAISEADSNRFKKLFDSTTVEVMNNIKFDRLSFIKERCERSKTNPLIQLANSKRKIVVLGSVRAEEEETVGFLIRGLQQKNPDIDIWLFPRHMHRIDAWKQKCNELKIKWQLRSEIKSINASGDIIIWDKFGELGFGYELADAAFVGGSLAPLGGQNFLEVLETGIVPVTGPFWENFIWTGEAIIKQGLLYKEADWESVLDRLSQQIQNREPREIILKKLSGYLNSRRGGTAFACEQIKKLL